MKKKKLITSALPYVNNEPHLGNIIGSVLSADVYARFCRKNGYETLYICATDEYGTPIVTKAMELGLSPKETADKFHPTHKDIYKYFNIQFDEFGRTTCSEHIEITQSIFKDLEREGAILEEESEQAYCEHDQMFLADRYVVGECPHCHDDGARGDQCDLCGKLLQTTELINPSCKICGKTPTTRKTKHLYLNLPELEEDLAKYHEKAQAAGAWSKNAIAVSKGWLDNGLQARPITRDLKWGIPVPREGYEEKVFYVWFDAPIGYISATAHAFPNTWKDWWQTPEETELYQFMGKDNIPFHTVIFPACLLGTKGKWTMLHHINSSEYLNYEGTKFSKSKKVGIFGRQAMESEFHVDLWRFYLLHNRPERSDTNFSWDTFLEEVNNTFIANIGNLLNRTLAFLHKQLGGELKPVSFSTEQQQFLDEVLVQEKEIITALEKVSLKEGLKQILALGKMGNKFFQDQEAWKTIKTDPNIAMGTVSALMRAVCDIAVMLEPYMPETSLRMSKMLSAKGRTFQDLGKWDFLNGIKVGKPEILFNKLDPKKIEEYREKYSGKEEEIPEQPEEIEVKDFWHKIELTVGEIKSVNPHPEADRLYVEEIDCGEDKVRTIVSGLVKYCTPEDLLGKKVLVASNLTPAKLRGVESQGMVLTAEKRKKLEVLDLQNFAIGSKVHLEGESLVEVKEEVNIDDFFASPIIVDNFQLSYLGKRLMIEGKVLRTQKIERGEIK